MFRPVSLTLAVLFLSSAWSEVAAKGGSSSGPKTVHVKGYTKKDGTVVAPHTRSAPRPAAREVPPVTYRTSPPPLSSVPTAPRTAAPAGARVGEPPAPAVAETAATPPPVPAPAEDDTPARKATYMRIYKALADVEAAAVAKYGRKPRPDDTAGFTVPYKVFVEREAGKSLDTLARKDGNLRHVLDRIRVEGDDKGWPKQ